MSAARARNRAQQEEEFRQEEAEHAAAEVPERSGAGRGSLPMRSASGRERPSLVRRPLRPPSPETGGADTSSEEGEGDEGERRREWERFWGGEGGELSEGTARRAGAALEALRGAKVAGEALEGLPEGCPICLGEAGEGALALLPCRHAFHLACLARWLFRGTKCPLCRSEAGAR